MNRVLPKRDDKQFESTRGRCTTHALVDMLCMWHIALLDQSQRARVCSRVRPDVRDRQTSDRRETKASLNASTLWGRKHNKIL